MQPVTLEMNGDIAVVTLSNPDKRNALDGRLMSGVVSALQQAEERRARVAILKALPVKGVWSAGHDIDELPEGGRDPLGYHDPFRTMIRAVINHPSPIIACIEGGVWGGAFELTLAADIVVATPQSTFALTPAKIGVPYYVEGLSAMLGGANLHLLKEMIFTARPVLAARLHHFGMINHLADASEIHGFCDDMAKDAGRLAPLAIRAMKAEIQALSAARPLPPGLFEALQELRRKSWEAEDHKEGVTAFKAGRKPVFRGV